MCLISLTLLVLTTPTQSAATHLLKGFSSGARSYHRKAWRSFWRVYSQAENVKKKFITFGLLMNQILETSVLVWFFLILTVNRSRYHFQNFINLPRKNIKKYQQNPLHFWTYLIHSSCFRKLGKINPPLIPDPFPYWSYRRNEAHSK